jgi:hypothetical protein
MTRVSKKRKVTQGYPVDSIRILTATKVETLPDIQQELRLWCCYTEEMAATVAA